MSIPALRLLPLSDVCRHPSDLIKPAQMIRDLGANAVLLNITEEEWQWSRDNIDTVIRRLVAMRFRVYINPWCWGGATGGEAGFGGAALLADTNIRSYLMADRSFGRSFARSLQPLFELAAAAGAEGVMFDEIKLDIPDGEDTTKVSRADFNQALDIATNNGLKTIVCLAVTFTAVVDQLIELARLPHVDIISGTRYYTPGPLGIEPNVYLGEIIEQLVSAIQTEHLRCEVLWWGQGFDIGSRIELMRQMADAIIKHGGHHIGLWAGLQILQEHFQDDVQAADWLQYLDAIEAIFSAALDRSDSMNRSMTRWDYLIRAQGTT